jgi:uncharacterized protein (TIGR02722 family)
MRNVITIFLILGIVLTGCTSTRKVKRIEETETIDLSGRWNDTDSRLVAEEMIRDVLSREWLNEYSKKQGRRPALVVGLVQNKSHEHISTDTFIKDIERELINSGRVRVVQAGDAREQLRKERGQQQEFASPDTVKRWGQEIGADFILQGVLNSIVDTSRKKKVVFYQVDLELGDIETNETVWIGSKKIKKLVKN